MGDVENFLDYRGGEKVDFLDFNTQGSALRKILLLAAPTRSSLRSEQLAAPPAASADLKKISVLHPRRTVVFSEYSTACLPLQSAE